MIKEDDDGPDDLGVQPTSVYLRFILKGETVDAETGATLGSNLEWDSAIWSGMSAAPEIARADTAAMAAEIPLGVPVMITANRVPGQDQVALVAGASGEPGTVTGLARGGSSPFFDYESVDEAFVAARDAIG